MIRHGTGSVLLVCAWIVAGFEVSEMLNRPVLFFAVCLVAGFDIALIARAILG